MVQRFPYVLISILTLAGCTPPGSTTHTHTHTHTLSIKIKPFSYFSWYILGPIRCCDFCSFPDYQSLQFWYIFSVNIQCRCFVILRTQISADLLPEVEAGRGEGHVLAAEGQSTEVLWMRASPHSRGQDPPPLHVGAPVGVGAQRSTGWPPHPDRCLPPPRSTPGSSDPLINTLMVLWLDTRHTMTDYQHFRPTTWRLKLHPQTKCRWYARKATEPRCLDEGVWLRAEQAGTGGIGIHSWENRDSLIKRYLIEQRCQIYTNQYFPIECAP